MFFKRLFARAATADTPTPEQLTATVLHDPDSAARRDACHRITDLATLRRVASDDAIAFVRDLAAARYRKLLCGIDADAPPLSERRAELGRVDDQSLLSQIALQASEAELRRTAIDALADEPALLECAVNDILADNRLRAAERIEGREALEELARRIGKRDKRVYRLARQQLKALNERDERPRLVRQRGEAICDKLAGLGRFDNWVQDHALLGLLEQQWAELEAEADAEIKARYDQLRGDFLARYNAYAEANAAQIAAEQARRTARERAQALADELDTLATQDDLAQIDARLAEIEERWQEIAADADAAAGRACTEALARVHERRDQLAEAGRRARAAERMLADARKLLERGEIDRKALKDLRRRRERLRGDAAALPAAVAEPLDAALAQIEQRLEKQRKQVARKLAALPEKLAELDAHFAAGRVKKAEPLYQSILATLDQARSADLPRSELAPAESHLKDIAPQLRELQRWRRWGADTKREDLCAELERLAADTDHEPEPLANRLRELRETWRELHRDGAPADDALWQRFQAAAGQIQQRCRPFLESQSKIRAANRAQREALCDELETFLDKVDWDRMDWKKAVRAEREMRRAWSALGPPDGRGQRALEGRFRKLLRRLDQALDGERERNRALKQDLITQMRSLADEPDLRSAIDTAKTLQQQWHTTVPGRQRDENALWKDFRAASDAVFSRRAEQQQARTAELREHQAAREALCDELAALTQQATDAEALTTGLRALETRWRDTDQLPLPRQVVSGLRKRWQSAEDAARRRLRELEQQERWAAVARLEQRADYCDQSARRVVADPPGADTTALAAGWGALPAPDDGALARRLDAAFEQVLAAAGDEEARAKLARQMDANAERRLNLCLHLEITAGVDSPPELEQQRMALQVSRLQGHLGGDAEDPYADASQLLRDWYLCTPCGPVDGLDARFGRIKRALSAEASEAA